jgi:hypothetical protein
MFTFVMGFSQESILFPFLPRTVIFNRVPLRVWSGQTTLTRNIKMESNLTHTQSMCHRHMVTFVWQSRNRTSFLSSYFTRFQTWYLNGFTSLDSLLTTGCLGLVSWWLGPLFFTACHCKTFRLLTMTSPSTTIS